MKIFNKKEWKKIQDQETREKELKHDLFRFGELSELSLEDLLKRKENLILAKKETVEYWKNDPMLKGTLGEEEKKELIACYENEVENITREILLTEKAILSKEKP